MGRRVGISTILIAGAVVLVVAIFIGNNMGNHVLAQIDLSRSGALATAVPIPAVSAADDLEGRGLVRRRVLSVATDPAFPDPRVTPEPPTPAPTPRPTPTPKQRPTARPTEEVSPSPPSSPTTAGSLDPGAASTPVGPSPGGAATGGTPPP